MNKVTEIFTAWKIAYDPTLHQSKMAEERIKICDSCEFKSSVPFPRCTICGCALKKKIFSPVKGACPKGKWNEVDNQQ